MCAACIERNISSHCFSICQFAYLLFPSVSVCPCVSLSNSVWLSFYINLSLYFSFFLVAQLIDSLTVCRSIGPLVLFHERSLFTKYTKRCQTNRFVAVHAIGVHLFPYQIGRQSCAFTAWDSLVEFRCFYLTTFAFWDEALIT